VFFAPLGNHHTVNHDARDLHLTRAQATTLGNTLDLYYDAATGVVGGHGDGEGLQRQRLTLHRDVTVRIGGRPAHDADIDRKSAVE
jgi:hypothetical protein